MRKIPTLFVRDPDDMRHVTDEVHPDCGWVVAGEGVVTRKVDGWCCMVDDDSRFWKRAEVKRGRAPQPGFVEVEFDKATGKRVGWVPVGAGPEDRWFREAFDRTKAEVWDPAGIAPEPATYELIGPKVQGNPEKVTAHILVRHVDLVADMEVTGVPRHPDYVREMVARVGAELGWEGVVWHHPDGRMAKLKARDLARTPTNMAGR